MFLTNLFRLKKECSHDKISPNVERGYCPDCGQLIENEWYITRCACCGVKRKTVLRNGNVEPEEHFCTNCGESYYTTEKLNGINFIDINYAVLRRKVVNSCTTEKPVTQFWQEKTIELPRLQVQY